MYAHKGNVAAAAAAAAGAGSAIAAVAAADSARQNCELKSQISFNGRGNLLNRNYDISKFCGH